MNPTNPAMTTTFLALLKEFAAHQGMQADDSAYALEWTCEGHPVMLMQHPLHADCLLAEVGVGILDSQPPANQLALLLQINEAARFEHDWVIMLDGEQQVSLSRAASLTGMSLAQLEALLLDGADRAQVLKALLDELRQLPTTAGAEGVAGRLPGVDTLMIRA
jgi:hypothetical protein